MNAVVDALSPYGVTHLDLPATPQRIWQAILMRQRIAEIGEHAVAHQSGGKATIAGHYLGDAAMIDGDDVAQILWIEPCRQLSRANEVAEHHGQLATLGLGWHR